MISAEILYILDFDRTVFNTDMHFADLCEVLLADFNVNVEDLKEEEHRLTKKPGVYSALDNLRYSDENYDIDQIKATLQERLGHNGKDYLYEDVAEFLLVQRQRHNPIFLITVGTDEYQEQKRVLSPLIINLPMLITQQPKSQVLREKLSFEKDHVSISHNGAVYSAKRAVLVDDRAGTFDADMPRDPRLELVRIRRPRAAHSKEPTPPGIKEISSLSELLDGTSPDA